MKTFSHPSEEPKTFLNSLINMWQQQDVSGLKELYTIRYPALLEQQYIEVEQEADDDDSRRGRTRTRKFRAADESGDFSWLSFIKSPSENKIPNILFKELYFRLLYQNKDISMKIRTESWENYISLFDALQTTDVNIPFTWMWDIFDEFLYQTQINTHARCRETDTVGIRKNINIWNPKTVIQILDSVFSKRSSTGASGLEENAAAFYAKVMLIRIHVQLGDYHNALEEVRSIRANDHTLSVNYDKVHRGTAGCLLTLYYYGGFSFLMMRRYTEAQAFFRSALSCRGLHPILYQQQNITNILRQTHASLAIALTLSPEKVDDYTKSLVRETLDELPLSLADEELFRDIFKRACPKYIAPSTEEHSDSVYNISPFTLMESHCMFLFREIKQQSACFTVRGFLKMYSKVPHKKLLALQSSELGSEASAACQLLAVKHKSLQCIDDKWGYVMSTGKDFHADEKQVLQRKQTSAPNFPEYTKEYTDGILSLKHTEDLVSNT